MTAVIGWSVVAFVLVVLLVLICWRASVATGAVGYTRGHGYCPNMGACTDCDICEED